MTSINLKSFFRTAKNVIASARMTIAKAQALIQDHELKLANEKKKVEELEITKHLMQKEQMTTLLSRKPSGHNWP